MHILFVTRKYPPSMGGMEVFSHELFSHLKDIEPGCVLYRPDPPIMGRPRALQLIGFFLGAMRMIASRRRQTDILLLGDMLLLPLAMFARMVSMGRIRCVAAAHGNDIYFARNSSLPGRIYAGMLALFRHSVARVVANSSDIQRATTELGFRKVERVLLGTRMPEASSHAPAHREDTILFAGRLALCKGLGWFLGEVVPRLTPPPNILVAGPEWDESEKKALERCPNARYLGTLSRDKLDEIRSRVAATVMPNLPAEVSGQNEGFGLAALESAATGTPVVASRLGGLAEAVVDGVTGFLVTPMDARGFARSIQSIRSWSMADRDDFSRRAIAEIKHHFTWRRVAEDYMGIFRDMTRTENL